MKPSCVALNFVPRVIAVESATAGVVGVMAPKIVQGQSAVTVSLLVVLWILPESSIARTWMAPGPVPVWTSV